MSPISWIFLMKRNSTCRGGFTLVEVSAATAILVLVLTLAMAGLVYIVRSNIQGDAQNELDIDVQAAMESIKYDLRLSSLDEMFFYPAGAGPYQAVSMPIARDDDGDGAVDLNEDGSIIWDKTLVYHVWMSLPYQLRVTTFDPRDDGLTDAHRQAQINSVVTNGHGTATHNGGNASTRVVFENLFDWHVSPRGAIYDAYSADTERDSLETMGSCILGAGSHTFTFTAIDKNAASSGYKIGLDSLFVSPCYGAREAEAQLPATASVGATPVGMYMAGGSWSGNYQLYFPGVAAGNSFTLTMDNDRWEETNFKGIGSVFSNTTVRFDESLSPSDFVVSLDAYGYKWYANEQTGDTNGAPAALDAVRGCAVRVPLRGDEMANGGWISSGSSICWVFFRSGAASADKLKILAAYIGECSSTDSNSMDVAAGTQQALTFGSPAAPGITVDGGQTRFSNYAVYPVDKEKSYVVSFLVDGAAAMGNAWEWQELSAPTAVGSYIIPAASSPTAADLAAPVWSTRGDVMPTNSVLGVRMLYGSYPTNGSFTSQIIDTHLGSPAYTQLDWNKDQPSGSYLGLKVRTGSSNDLSDAASWGSISAMTSPGAISPGNHRYVQFRAELRPSFYGISTPRLKDVTIKWTGAEQVVDIGGTFTKGPDYGVFEVEVDGVRVMTGVEVYLKIFKDVYGYVGSRRMTSCLTTEITPRNTGK